MTTTAAMKHIERALQYADDTGAPLDQVMVGETGWSVLALLKEADIELNDVRQVPSGAMYRLARIAQKPIQKVLD